MIKYVMINSNEVVRITNISRSTYMSENCVKHNEEDVQYIWENKFPIENPKYVKGD